MQERRSFQRKNSVRFKPLVETSSSLRLVDNGKCRFDLSNGIVEMGTEPEVRNSFAIMAKARHDVRLMQRIVKPFDRIRIIAIRAGGNS